MKFTQITLAVVISFAMFAATDAAAPDTLPRQFYSGDFNGKGKVDQWQRGDGYFFLYYFYRQRQSDTAYQRRELYIFDADPAKRVIAYDPRSGQLKGRFDGRGYALVKPQFSRVSFRRAWRMPDLNFSPMMQNPRVPDSPDNFAREFPPPLNGAAPN